MVKSFEEFIEEDYNYFISDIGEIEFEDRWFYYNVDDEIIYGCNDVPVDKDYLFYFNPKSCIIVIDGKEHVYDVNNPICLISYKFEDNEVKVYTDTVIDYLEKIGYKSFGDLEDIRNKKKIQELFDKRDEDYKFLLMYGNKVISTTFDIIEEN